MIDMSVHFTLLSFSISFADSHGSCKRKFGSCRSHRHTLFSFSFFFFFLFLLRFAPLIWHALFIIYSGYQFISPYHDCFKTVQSKGCASNSVDKLLLAQPHPERNRKFSLFFITAPFEGAPPLYIFHRSSFLHTRLPTPMEAGAIVGRDVALNTYHKWCCV